MLELNSKLNAYGTQRGYFEVLAPAPGGSLVNKDREVAL